MDNDKLKFLTNGAFDRLDALNENATGNWGVMNAQQMVEHLSDFFSVSTEKIKTKCYTPEEHLPKYMEFLMSDKEFRENTKAPADLLGDVPLPLRAASMGEAKEHLKKSVNDFVEYFKEDKKTLHLVFGMLNFDAWVRLHHKHVMHHLKQFGLVNG